MVTHAKRLCEMPWCKNEASPIERHPVDGRAVCLRHAHWTLSRLDQLDAHAAKCGENVKAYRAKQAAELRALIDKHANGPDNPNLPKNMDHELIVMPGESYTLTTNGSKLSVNVVYNANGGIEKLVVRRA